MLKVNPPSRSSWRYGGPSRTSPSSPSRKVSVTALVLDEIINHVQSLQRQVEYLSMRLTAVNPRVDFGGIDNFLTTEARKIEGLTHIAEPDDVISRLDALRGKDMAAKYSLSCKRRYKNGFVCHDLSDGDLLLPT